MGAARPPEWTPKPTEWGEGEGGRKASGVAENPGGGRDDVGGGVELSQGASTPRVDEEPGGGTTPRGTTATEVGPREDG